jgi:plasmid stabilization system protein ParE
MELEVYWTDFSKKELKNIFNYYKENTSLHVAKRLVIGITKETIKLKKQPNIGPVEEFLKEDSRDFRYLVYKNYKIIYLVNLKENRIDVFDVFDTRQNPMKIMLGK